MKIAAALLVLLALARTIEIDCVPLSHKNQERLSVRSLQDDLNDFLALIPTEKLRDLSYQYLQQDEDFREALNYIMSEEFASILVEIESMSEIRELLKFLETSGLDVYGFLNKVHRLLGIDPIQPKKILKSTRITGGLAGYIEDVKAILPIKEIQKLYYQKLKTSKDFKNLITRLKSDEFKGIIAKVWANPKLQDLIQRAAAKGVDVQAIFDWLSKLIDQKFASMRVQSLTRNLNDDLDDFLALIPTQKLIDLFYQYLENDEDFREALDYVMSKEFTSLLVEIESMSEVPDLLNFLESSGLDAYGFINKIHKFLKIDPIQTKKILRSTRITGGFPGFIEEVKAIIPVKEIQKLYYEKLKTSKDFKNLITRLKSDKFQGLINKIWANPKLQDLIQRVAAKGVDVQAILDFLSRLLGLEFPSKLAYLKSDEEVIEILRYVWSRIDVNRIAEIAEEYLLCDEDIKKVVKFVLGDEFKRILLDIEDIKEMKDLLKFFYDTGVDVYKVINELHAILGIIDRLPLLMKKDCNISGGISGLLDDVWALVPREELCAYYSEKRQTNKKFNDFVTRLEKQELRNAIKALNENDGFKLLLAKLEPFEVDYDKIVEIIASVIGIKFPF